MALRDRSGLEGEYSGVGGIIQPESKGHSSRSGTNADRKGVDEDAMVLRRASAMERAGVLKFYSETLNEDGYIDIVQIPYDEETARQDLSTPH